MKKAMLVVLALAAMVVPAALATPPAQAPSAYCKANPALIGAGKTYRNMGACVSRQAALAAANTTNAAKACKAELADANFAAGHDGKTFEQFYGSGADKGNGNGRAYGSCVSQKASGKTAEQQNAQVNAAKKCRTAPLRDQIGVGTGKAYRNFGTCVAAQTKLA